MHLTRKWTMGVMHLNRKWTMGVMHVTKNWTKGQSGENVPRVVANWVYVQYVYRLAGLKKVLHPRVLESRVELSNLRLKFRKGL